MRTLTINEVETISGGGVATTLLAAYGALNGAFAGGAIGIPVAFVGIAFACTGHNGIIWEGVKISAGIGCGAVVIGAALGGLMGYAGGSALESIPSLFEDDTPER